MSSEIDRLVAEQARALGLTRTGSGQRLVQATALTAEERAERKAKRKAEKEKAKTPILNVNAEVEDDDVEEAIRSIQSVPTAASRAEEEAALASIMAAMQGRA